LKCAFAQVASRHDAHDLGDHVAGAAHDHGVADAHVLAAHLVLVVQRRVRDRDAADEHRRETRDRRDRAGAADLHLDVEDLGRHFLGRELVRDGEARRARDEAERLLLRQCVDLVDDPVDLVGKLRALGAEVLVVAEQPREARDERALVRDREAHLREPVHQCAVRVRPGRLPPVDLADAVGEEREPPRGGRLRVELPKPARRGIARVDEGLLALPGLRGIEAQEVLLEHDDLAAHLEVRGGGRRQGERDRRDRAEVGRHVLAGGAVAARRAHREPAVAVDEAHREAVELGLAGVPDDLDAQRVARAAVERVDVRVGERVVERQHRRAMLDRLERVRRRAGDPLRRRVGRAQVRVRVLDLGQLAHPRVVLAVGRRRCVDHVVLVVGWRIRSTSSSTRFLASRAAMAVRPPRPRRVCALAGCRARSARARGARSRSRPGRGSPRARCR
jgi:hypothetical protein